MSLRKKFKATKVDTIAKQEKRVEQVTPKSNNSRAGYLDIDEGSNTFRIFPSHEEEKSFCYPKTVHWIPQEVEEKDKSGDPIKDKSGNPKMIIKNLPIFNSRIHGGTAKDIIEEYCAFAEKTLTDECQDQEQLSKDLDKLYNWKTGIKPKTSWIMYAKKIKFDDRGKIAKEEFGRLEAPTSVKDKMNELASSGRGPVQLDPFTDCDDGKAITIDYDKKETPQNKYKVALEWQDNWPLTDEELEDFEKQEPLFKIFEGAYKRSDFEKALEGLRIFDEQNKFNLFEYSEWTDICEEISAYYPETDEESSNESSDDNEEETNSDNSEEEDALTEMDRDELIQFINEQEFEIRVMRKDTAETLRSAIREELKFLQEEKGNKEEERKEEGFDPEKDAQIEDGLEGLTRAQIADLIKGDDTIKIRVMSKDTKETLIEALREDAGDLPWDRQLLADKVATFLNGDKTPTKETKSTGSKSSRMQDMKNKMNKK